MYSKAARERKLIAFRKKLLKAIKFLLFATLIITTLGTIFLSLFSAVYYLKTGKKILILKLIKHDKQRYKMVKWLKKVPEYPYSKFVFEDVIKDPKDPKIIQNPPYGFNSQDIREIVEFLNRGNSVYLITNEDSFDKVAQFYQKILPSYGWEKVREVQKGDPDHLDGIYFYNPKLKKGLRIYTIYHDIWYQTITYSQAINALADKVLKIKQKDFELKAKSGKTTPKSTFWILSYPADWKLEIIKSPVMKVPDLVFKNSRTGASLTIKALKYTPAPVADLSFSQIDKVLKEVIKNYLAETNTSFTFSDFKLKHTLTPSAKASISCADNKQTALCFAVIPNAKNTIYYAVHFKGKDPTFFYYVIRNIKSVK